MAARSEETSNEIVSIDKISMKLFMNLFYNFEHKNIFGLERF